ncbi:efflux RND transporter periplasmic adaptor subunit [Vibrio metschnikovii]|uniref:efflux RND transporter periplasmic adaptor subunit n=1 Tax=Vibrio metschnikovii TaxID=28172 RepID=UPI001C2FB5EF|nr:efflux RND transporter periplasmic adaptor subunit [Vibrio metschnikovii]
MAIFRVSSLAFFLIAVTGCSDSNNEQNPYSDEAVPVEAFFISPRPEVMTTSLPGRIEPIRVAEVRARVAGIVQQRHFIQGAMVEKGDLLFTIDPEPSEAALARAKGALAQAKAGVRQAESVVQRYEPLVEIDAVSRQEYDDALAALEAARANQISAQAEVSSAELDLGYATVRAPISGRVGKSLVSEGSLVGQGESTPMALIQQMDPIYADFTQPASAVLQLREAIAEGRLTRDGEHVNVAINVDGTRHVAEGHLLFSDISVDRSTGQVTLRGEFPNAEGFLLPGMYVRGSVETGKNAHAIFVPQRAVQFGLDGVAKVMMVSEDGVVEERSVETGIMRGSEWQIISGLSAGDRLIVKGVDKVAVGMPVTVTNSISAQTP